jgi:hypothetical protein
MASFLSGQGVPVVVMTVKGEKAVSSITWGEVSLGNSGREVREKAILGGKLIVREEGRHALGV